MLKKITKGLTAVLLTVFLISSLSSCVFTTFSLIKKAKNEQKKVLINGKRLKPKSFDSPEENTLVFFTLKQKHGLFGDPDVDALLIQVDPNEKHYKVRAAKLANDLRVFAPLPPGSDMQVVLTSWSTSTGNTSTTHYQTYPLCSTPDITMRFKTKKTGLQYIGEYQVKDGNYVYIGSKEELASLKNLKKYVKKTEWEKLVDKRIKELGGEAK